jgi:retron-type reverse transcriptase
LKADLNDVTGTQYCLKVDVRKFYPTIDHSILKGIIRKKIKDVALLELLDGIIDSVPDDEGVPIGNYLSQFFANLYLSELDHLLKEHYKVKYYYRYADDIVILDSSKQRLHGLLVAMNDYLHTERNQCLKSNFQIFPVESRGIDFIGYVFYHTHVLARKKNK